MKSKTQMRAMMKQEKKMATARRKERKKGKCPAKKKEEKKGKRKEKRGKKNENEMSGPNSSLKQGKDNKNYEITKLPLNTNLGYYILPSL